MKISNAPLNAMIDCVSEISSENIKPLLRKIVSTLVNLDILRRLLTVVVANFVESLPFLQGFHRKPL